MSYERAVIFDMDGVLSDTQLTNAAVESEALARHGVSISPEEITERFAGVKNIQWFGELLRDRCTLEEIALVVEEVRSESIACVTQGVRAINGSFELVRTLYWNGFKLAVATSSHGRYAHTVLKTLKLLSYFPIVVSGDRVSCSKPDPESFLLAARELGVEPKSCLVIEDGLNGMKGAVAAGMSCIGLVSDFSLAYPTTHLVTSLREVTVEMVGRVIDGEVPSSKV